MIANYVADIMIKPGKSPVFNSPDDFGLDYEDVTFQTSDGVSLSGWLIKGGRDKVIIQSHFGVQCSRAGYTPEGQGFIKDMPALNMWDTTYFQSRFAQGAAIGIILLVLVSVLIIPYLITSLRQQEER